MHQECSRRIQGENYKHTVTLSISIAMSRESLAVGLFQDFLQSARLKVLAITSPFSFTYENPSAIPDSPFIYIVTDHPRWLSCVYVLQALGLSVGHDCGSAPLCRWVCKRCWWLLPGDTGEFASWEVHVYKSSTYVLKPPKLGALERWHATILICCERFFISI